MGGEAAKVGAWVVSILPMIEQQPLRDIWDDTNEQVSWNVAFQGDPSQLNRFYPNLSLLLCPSDVLSSDETVGANSYACNAGGAVSPLQYDNNAEDSETESVRGQRKENCVFNNRLPRSLSAPPWSNVIGATGAKISLDAINDGSSQTIALSENLQALPWTTVSTQIPNDSLRMRYSIVWIMLPEQSIQTPWKINGQPLQVLQSNRMADSLPANANPRMARPSSLHTGSVNVAMLDGSVKSVSEGIAYEVYQALMTPRTKQSDMPNNVFLLQDDDF
jgi:prepilin-type processing-associated H-X9-DG protein